MAKKLAKKSAKKIKVGLKDSILYVVIFVLLAINVFLLVLVWNMARENSLLDVDVGVGGVERVGVVEHDPVPIVKSSDVVEAENNLRVVRNITKSEDGVVTVRVSLEGVDTLEDGMVLNDFADDVKFGERVEVLDGRVLAENGFLFPSKEKINLSTYGPGPVDEKSTMVNIVLLDINFDNSSENTSLYEFTFSSKQEVPVLIFDGGEFRSGKYILGFDKEIIPVE